MAMLNCKAGVLSNYGKCAFNVAKDIGVSVAAEAINEAPQLGTP